MEINIKELRIGSYLYNYKDQIVKTDLIASGFIEIEDDLDTYYLDEIKPIHLTPDILERCGFENDNMVIKHIMFIWYNDHLGIKGMLGVVKPHECKYLHQLQNIIYDLTGIEIELK